MHKNLKTVSEISSASDFQKSRASAALRGKKKEKKRGGQENSGKFNTVLIYILKAGLLYIYIYIYAMYKIN